MVKRNILETFDYKGRKVIFTYKKWKEKQSVHPELGNKNFLLNIKKALENPDEVWEDHDDAKNRYCCYKKYSTVSYVKAVVWLASNPLEVVTAYEINFIKETKYPDLKRLK